jgi:ATP-dependent DNA helicase RecG
MYNLSDDLSTLKIKSSYIELLKSINIITAWDLLLYIPKRYTSFDVVERFCDTKVNTNIQVNGEIIRVEILNFKKPVLQVIISDGYEEIKLLFFKYYPNYKAQFNVGKIIKVTGTIKLNYYKEKTIIHPKTETILNSQIINNSITSSNSVYRLPAGINHKQFKKLVQDVYNNVAIPEYILIDSSYNYNLITLKEAIKILHMLDNVEYDNDMYNFALTRLKIEELFVQQLIMHDIYLLKHKHQSYLLKDKKKLTRQLINNLSFQLTKSQQIVIEEITHDLKSGLQMNRLLQGDVGSGKTIVAIYALLIAIENNYQACIIAPTEILAKQHYIKTKQLLDPLEVEILWLTGSLTIKQKQEIYYKIKKGTKQIVIGTHAIFQNDVEFNNLAIAIIDEQHRFGVKQRISLENKGNKPHILMMSATPIPRTIAMSYYADLDLSVINELPKGRVPIKTYLINSNNRDKLYSFIANQLMNNSQVYWVCPLIEESEKLDLQNVIKISKELQEIFIDYQIEFIHGKMKQKEIDIVMQNFINNKIQILVATTVIEVGVDVANASVIVIEDSQRMGLATLHQLRGRVGRGNKASHCLLLFNYPLTDIAKKRLKLMEKTNDGFEIAKEDLLIRGPGEILGERQSGVPLLRFADLEQDIKYLPFVKELINKHNNRLEMLNYIKLWFKNYTGFLLV